MNWYIKYIKWFIWSLVVIRRQCNVLFSPAVLDSFKCPTHETKHTQNENHTCNNQ